MSANADASMRAFLSANKNPAEAGSQGNIVLPLKSRCAAVGAALSRPSFVPAPGFAVKLLLGEAATIVLDGQNVLPKKAQELGFTFRHPEVEEALRNLLS